MPRFNSDTNTFQLGISILDPSLSKSMKANSNLEIRFMGYLQKGQKINTSPENF